MVQVTYPGVYIQEIPSGVHTITSVATSITAFIDFFKEGPMNEAVEIFGMTDFQRVFGGLDDHGSLRQPADDPVPRREVARLGLRTKRVLGHHGSAPRAADLFHQAPVLGWIHNIDAAPEHSYGPSFVVSAPRCAWVSIPLAMPLTMVKPAAESSDAIRRVTVIP